jgi:hypothetical protein
MDMDKAKDAAGEYVDKADDAAQSADTATDKLPGEADDEAVDQGQGLIDKGQDALGGT